MKKFSTFLMALMMVLSATAANLTPIMGKAVKAEKSFATVTNVAKAQKAQELAAKKAGKPAKVAVTNLAARTEAVKNVSKKAAAAPAETIDLTFDNTQEPSFEYYSADGDWYLGWPDVTKTYIVRLDYVVGFEGKFGHYTIADLDLDYSFLSDYSSGTRVDVDYTDADFTMKDEGNDTWSLSGYVVCSDGNTYNLNGYYEKPQGETYDVELTDLVSAYYYDFDYDWYFKVANSEYSFTLDLVSESGMFAGEYTTEDALLNYCSVSTLTGNESVESLEISIVSESLVEPLEIPAAFELTGSIVTTKGNTYNVHLQVTAPLEPKQIINANVECVEFEWPTSDYPGVAGRFSFMDTDVPSRAFEVAVAQPAGEFTVGDGIVKEYTGMVDYSTLMPYMVDNGTVSVSLDVDKMVLVVDAQLVCADTIQYNFTSEIPVELAGEKTLTFTNLHIDDSWAGFFGIYFYDAENSEAAISGDFMASDLADYEFEPGEIACTVYTEEAGEVYSLIYTYAHIYNNGWNLDMTFIGEDMVLYTVNAKFEKPDPEDDIEVTLTTLELTDLRSTMGAWQISGYDPDSTVWASVVVYSETIDGSYTMDDMGDLLSYNQIAFMNEEGALLDECPLYELYENIVVTSEEVEGVLTVHVEAYGQYGTHRAKLHLTAGPKSNDQDMKEDVFAEYATEDIVNFEVDAEEGYAYLRVVKDDEMFAALIYLEEGATELPAGTYEINDSFEPGTVQPGQISGNSVYPTFWATMDEEGYLNLPLFWCTTGTVEVSYDEAGELVLDLNSVNTNGYNAHITVNANKVGLNNTNAAVKATKSLKNAQLVIEKNGKTFNAFGAEL